MNDIDAVDMYASYFGESDNYKVGASKLFYFFEKPEIAKRISKEVKDGGFYITFGKWKKVYQHYRDFDLVASGKDSIRTFLIFWLLREGYSEKEILKIFKGNNKYRSLRIAKNYIETVSKIKDRLVQFLLKLKKKGVKDLETVTVEVLANSELCCYFPNKLTKEDVDRYMEALKICKGINQILIYLLRDVDGRIVAKLLGVWKYYIRGVKNELVRKSG